MSNRRVLCGAKAMCHVVTKGMSLQCPLLTQSFRLVRKGELKHFSNPYNDLTTCGIQDGHLWWDTVIEVVARQHVASSGAFLSAMPFGVSSEFASINRELIPRVHTSLDRAAGFSELLQWYNWNRSVHSVEIQRKRLSFQMLLHLHFIRLSPVIHQQQHFTQHF